MDRCRARALNVVAAVALGNGWYRGRLGFRRRPAPIRRRGAAARPARRPLRGRPAAARRHRLRVAAPGYRCASPTTSTTARPSTRATRSAAWPSRRRHLRVDEAVHELDFDTDLLASDRARPSAPRGPRPSRSGRRPRADPPRLRAEPRGLVRVPVRGRGGHRDHAAPRRGARARRAGHAPAAHARGDRPLHPERRARRLRADVHLPRLPVRGGHGLAGIADATDRRRSRSGRPLRYASAPARSSCSDSVCSTSCTRTSCGACAATSSTSPPTARSATSGSAGPATSPCSRPAPRSSSTSSAFLARVADDVVDRAGARRGPRAVVAPNCLKYDRRPTACPSPEAPPSGVTRPWGCRGRCGGRTATRPSARASTPHARTRPEGRGPVVAGADCGTRGSSSETGSTRRHPRNPGKSRDRLRRLATACAYRTAHPR